VREEKSLKLESQRIGSRRSDLSIINVDDVEANTVPGGGRIKRIIGSECAKNMALAIGIFRSGEGLVLHDHPKEEEFYYILCGKGTVTVGDQEKEVKEGDALYVPMGVKHRIVNTGNEELRSVFVLSPPTW